MNVPATNQSHVVRDIPPGLIFKNPENPRLVFRDEEMATLMQSIKKYGIQVPITVYKDGEGYFLIDGERRWRCASKLNLKKIPALVQEKPTALTNLLLMFNIHALREQWDYLTIANKLPRIIDLHLASVGREPNEVELSELTGLTRGQIRRCRLLLDLPEQYRNLLFQELDLPKSKQRLSEDFFIEMERSLKSVAKRLPSALESIDSARDVLIEKYRNRTINNVVDLRKISKIVTAVSSLGADEGRAVSALKTVFSPNNDVNINQVYATEFELCFDERRLSRNIESILIYLDDVDEDSFNDQPAELKGLFGSLYKKLGSILGRV